jgi:hypothetical protein
MHVVLVQDVLVQALETRQQPDALGPQDEARQSGRMQTDLDALAAALGEELSLTPEQLLLLNSRLQQQQLDEQRAALEEDEAEEGAFLDAEAEAEAEAVLQEEGVAFDYEAAQGSASGTSKQHFEALLSSPLWRCQEEMAQVQLYQAIFLLMAWKMDYVVRDAAFIALLGILCKLLLPKVRVEVGAQTRAACRTVANCHACQSAKLSGCMPLCVLSAGLLWWTMHHVLTPAPPCHALGYRLPFPCVPAPAAFGAPHRRHTPCRLHCTCLNNFWV